MPILVTSVISIVSVPIYFRVLGDQMYAMWFYVGTLTGAFGFIDLGIGVAVARFMGVAMGAGDQQAVREYWSTGNVIVLPLIAVFAATFIAAGIIWAPEWFKVPAEDVATLRWAMVAGGIGLFFSYYGQMWFVLSAAHLDFRFVSVVRTGLSVATTIGTLLVAIVTRNAAWLVAFGTVASAAQFVILLHRGARHYKVPVHLPDFRWERLREMLPYTMKTFAQLVSGSVLGNADRLLLGRLAPAADFASYNVALNVGSRIQNLSQAAMGPIFCNATRGVGGDVDRQPANIYRESFAFLFPWYAAFLAWLLVWQEPLLRLWLGADANTVGQAFSWIVAGCCVAALGNLSGAQLGPIDRVGMGLGFSLAVSSLSALFVAFGWITGGLTGASAGFFAARLVLFVQDAVVRKLVGAHYRAGDFLPHLWIIGGVGVCIVARAIAGWLTHPIVPYLLGAAFSGLTMAVIVLLTSGRRDGQTN